MHSLKVASMILLVLSALVVPVNAQSEIDTFVMVPDAPAGGALVAGCFRAAAG